MNHNDNNDNNNNFDDDEEEDDFDGDDDDDDVFFYDGNNHNIWEIRDVDDVEEVVVPTSVQVIEEEAFLNWRNLTTVTFLDGDGDDDDDDGSSGLLKIGNKAFEGCTSLVFINIPTSVQVIGKGAFGGCTSLKSSIKIPEGIKCIERYTFWNCLSLISIIIPSSVERIDDHAFDSCKNLADVHFAANNNNDCLLKSIGSSTFYGCKSLKEIIIPESVEIIEGSAFRDCAALKEITIPGSVIEIGDYAFRSCEKLENITLNEGRLNKIGEYAFTKCKSLRYINIPKSVQIIKENAFGDRYYGKDHTFANRYHFGLFIILRWEYEREIEKQRCQNNIVPKVQMVEEDDDINTIINKVIKQNYKGGDLVFREVVKFL